MIAYRLTLTQMPHYTEPYRAIRLAAEKSGYWAERLRLLKAVRHSIHLAIFIEPYLTLLLQGKKTVESRFSSVRCAPFQRVRTGDVVLIKRSGGPIVGICEVGQVWSYELDPSSWREIRRSFINELCAQDPDFWATRAHASFATLMRVKNVVEVSPTAWIKRDRRGWVVVREADQGNPCRSRQ